jgi:hypothetical protein
MPFKCPVLMLPDPPFNIARHPNIKVTASTSHDVGVIHVLTHRASTSGQPHYLRIATHATSATHTCHPERSSSRTTRTAQSKDLHLLFMPASTAIHSTQR